MGYQSGNHWVEVQSSPPLWRCRRVSLQSDCASDLTDGVLGFAPRYIQNPPWWLAKNTPDGRCERLAIPLTACVRGQSSGKPTTRLIPLCSSGSLGVVAPKVNAVCESPI